MAEDLSRLVQLSRSCNNALQCLEALTSALDILSRIPPMVLTWIQPLISLFRLEGNISLRYKYDRSSRDLNEIGYRVVELIDVLQSLSEMADDEDRIGRIFSEVKKNQEVTHFDRQDITHFPELNDFLTELIARTDQAKTIYETIEVKCTELSTRNEAAESEASNQESAAKQRKFVFRTVAVSLTCAMGGVGLAVFTGKMPALLGAASIGVGWAGIGLSSMMSKEYLHKENEFHSTREKFKHLNQAAGHLQDIARESVFPAQTMNNDINVNFTRKNIPNQPPLLIRIDTSLDKLLKALKFGRRNFSDMRKEAEMIANATKVKFQSMPEYIASQHISRVVSTPAAPYAMQSDMLGIDTPHEPYSYTFIKPQYHYEKVD